MMLFEIIAILSCTIFAGAAIYINIAEHPARLECGTELAAILFAPSYKRSAAMQASLAIVATIAGVGAGVTSENILWYAGATLIFFVILFTFIAIMPTNKLLLDPERDRASEQTRELFGKWGSLYGIHSFISTIAAILFIYLGVK
jgi:hypothetical protein